MLSLEIADFKPTFGTSTTQQLGLMLSLIKDYAEGFLFLLQTNIIVKVS